MRGEEGDAEDNLLKELIIAVALLDHRAVEEGQAVGGRRRSSRIRTLPYYRKRGSVDEVKTDADGGEASTADLVAGAEGTEVVSKLQVFPLSSCLFALQSSPELPENWKVQ